MIYLLELHRLEGAIDGLHPDPPIFPNISVANVRLLYAVHRHLLSRINLILAIGELDPDILWILQG